MDTKKISLNRVPVQLMQKVTQVAEVYQMELLKTASSMDKNVLLINPEGKTTTITRQQLVNDLLSLRGQKIKLLSLKCGEKYTVMRPADAKCIAVKIPKSDKAQFIDNEGNVIPFGKVLVLPIGKVEVNNRHVDMTEALIFDWSLFRKTYKITKLSNKVLEKLNVSVESRERIARETRKKADAARKTLAAKEKADKLARQAAADTARVAEEAASAARNISRLPVAVAGANESAEARDYEVTAVLVNGDGLEVGMRVFDTVSRTAVNLEMQKVIALARNGELSNVKYVAGTDNRASYLAGIDMSIKNLPRFTV